MELDEIRFRVNMLKEGKEKDHRDIKDIELLLLWDFVKSIAENGINGQKIIAEFLLSSGIKSVHQIDLVDEIFGRDHLHHLLNLKVHSKLMMPIKLDL